MSGHQKAQQTPHRQAAHEHQSHEATRRLPLVHLHPLARTHHARRAQEPITQPEQELHDHEVKGVTRHGGAVAVDVA